MTGSKHLLSSYTEQEGPRVLFGDDNFGFTRGFRTLENDDVQVTGVSYVDGLKHNLLSVSQFCDNEFSVEFSTDQCTIKNRATQ